MNCRLGRRAAAGLVLVTLGAGAAPAQNRRLADSLFQAGRFNDAAIAYSRVIEVNKRDTAAMFALARIALIQNDLTQAERFLRHATKLDPESKRIKTAWAHLYYRRDDYPHAAEFYRAAGEEVAAEQLEAFDDDSKPYALIAPGDSTQVPFVITDPLPFVEVSINGNDPVEFILDTGGSQVYVDRDYAREIGVTEIGVTTGNYAGGQTAPTARGRLQSVTIGDFIVREVPVNLLGLRRVVLDGHPVLGVLGTELFAHFITTIDYPNGQLILRRKTIPLRNRLLQAAMAERQIEVPFGWQPPHYIVAWGSVNGVDQLWFVDTGLAGGGLTIPRATVDAAQITLREDQARESAGGGAAGAVRIVPFVADQVALGPASERAVAGTFGSFPASLELMHGFRIGGIISHAFFKPYALTFDFDGNRLYLRRSSP